MNSLLLLLMIDIILRTYYNMFLDVQCNVLDVHCTRHFCLLKIRVAAVLT